MEQRRRSQWGDVGEEKTKTATEGAREEARAGLGRSGEAPRERCGRGGGAEPSGGGKGRVGKREKRQRALVRIMFVCRSVMRALEFPSSCIVRLEPWLAHAARLHAALDRGCGARGERGGRESPTGGRRADGILERRASKASAAGSTTKRWKRPVRKGHVGGKGLGKKKNEKKNKKTSLLLSEMPSLGGGSEARTHGSQRRASRGCSL